jgi:DNA-directed RNA polymerase subunit H
MRNYISHIRHYVLVIKMHILQPKHTKLSQQEAKELLAKFNLSASQLPKIKKSDPALPTDSKPGDIIKIERKNEGNKTIYYRIVI